MYNDAIGDSNNQHAIFPAIRKKTDYTGKKNKKEYYYRYLISIRLANIHARMSCAAVLKLI